MIETRRLYYILGLGQTGLSVAHYLHRQKQDFEVFDDKISPSALANFQQIYPQIKVHVGVAEKQALALNTTVFEVIVSPGISLKHPVVQWAKSHNISVIGDIELFVRAVRTTPIVAITGTNGKSTVTTLVGEMAKAAGFKTLVGGNIGKPVLDFLNSQDVFDWIILEISSFQLESIFTLNAHIACILNITEDHMDRYASFDEYATTKHRIYNNAQHIVINDNDSLTWPKTVNESVKDITSFRLLPLKKSYAKTQAVFYLNQQNEKTFLAFQEQNWLNVHDLKIKGTHNWNNALAALAIGYQMKLLPELMCETLRQFSGLEHRCEWVRTYHQVDWYNDSKGTNVGATLSAIIGLGDAITGKIVLLLGGQSKEADFSDLCEPLKKYVRAVIVYGQDADKITTMLTKTDSIPLFQEKTFEKVIQTAHHLAKPHDIVLLSPACASWDMFDNYGHRGQVFKTLVSQLTEIKT